jgi:hypothetical protein
MRQGSLSEVTRESAALLRAPARATRHTAKLPGAEEDGMIEACCRQMKLSPRA